MEGYCSTGQSPQRAVVPVEEEEELKLCVVNALDKSPGKGTVRETAFAFRF
jgi:hypothetical protein